LHPLETNSVRQTVTVYLVTTRHVLNLDHASAARCSLRNSRHIDYALTIRRDNGSFVVTSGMRVTGAGTTLGSAWCAVQDARLTGRDAGVIACARDRDNDRWCERDRDDGRLRNVLASSTGARHRQLTKRPRHGDVLVSSRSSTTDYVVSVVPKRSGLCRNS